MNAEEEVPGMFYLLSSCCHEVFNLVKVASDGLTSYKSVIHLGIFYEGINFLSSMTSMRLKSLPNGIPG